MLWNMTWADVRTKFAEISTPVPVCRAFPGPLHKTIPISLCGKFFIFSSRTRSTSYFPNWAVSSLMCSSRSALNEVRDCREFLMLVQAPIVKIDNLFDIKWKWRIDLTFKHIFSKLYLFKIDTFWSKFTLRVK